ncbi:MAG: T9SS type A sorting domain-containing protein [Saprospiraceae bacterium]|nr:T9SS type A sorting domain-containing protein [Saprospiraceae bacterium]MBK9630091.1 T9SS type A sorting domain-containing protein [Saprospiraceae bacterium]
MGKYFFFLVVCVIYVSSVNVPNNPELEVTGAPGETTCMKCHGGGSFVGNVQIEGIPDTILAGQTYDVKLIHRSNARRAGFELTSLDLDHNRTGTLIQGVGTNVAVGRIFGRQYIRQSSARILNNGETSWDFKWKAPDTMQGDSVKFYFVSLAANSDGNNTGDNVLLNKKSYFYLNLTSGTENENSVSDFEIFPNPVNQQLRINQIPIGQYKVGIFNSNGEKLLSQNISGPFEIDIETLVPGVYHLNINGQELNFWKNFVKI